MVKIMFRNKLQGAALSLLLALGGAVFAQDKTPAPGTDAPQGRFGQRAGKQGRHGRRGKHGRQTAGRALRQLNLTDAQRQQLRDLAGKSAPQRQEARQLMQQKRAGTLDAAGQARLEQLKAQAKANKQTQRDQFLAILTPEQRAQLEQMKAQAKDRGLNLTDAQREQFKTLRQKYRQQDGPAREEAMKLMQQKRAGTLDAAGEARLQEIHKSFRAQQAARRAEFEALLTPEQKAKIEQMKQGRRGFGRGKHKPARPNN
jgi:Spy/CpxP family protein refolding chaperone